MAELKSLRSLTLDLPPSCIQFCPTKPHLFVVGTYFLHRNDLQGYESAQPDNAKDATPTESAEVSQASQKRTGSLILHELPQDNNITELCTAATDFAILDIQWTLHPDKLGNLLAVATSTGLLAFYRLQESSDIAQQPQLVLSCIKQITDDKTLVLSLTWHPLRPDVLAVTLSDGRVCLCTSSGSRANSDNDDAISYWKKDAVISMQDVHEHELEAWIVSFTPETAKVISGGDDMILQCSHITEESEQHEKLWQDRKLHEAGVTAILPLSDSLVVTGSYDDHIRLLSLPAIGRRKVLAELNLGGGVWRLKMLTPSLLQPSGPADDSSGATEPALQDHTRFLLLCSCMHAGTRVVSMVRDGDDWSFHVLARFEEHKSMNYGSDVHLGGASSVKTVVSTSFYDKLMCVWQLDLAAYDKES